MGQQKLRIVESDNFDPKCPYCERELQEIHRKTIEKYSWLMGVFATRESFYCCPSCHKILGCGQSRMG